MNISSVQMTSHQKRNWAATLDEVANKQEDKGWDKMDLKIIKKNAWLRSDPHSL